VGGEASNQSDGHPSTDIAYRTKYNYGLLSVPYTILTMNLLNRQDQNYQGIRMVGWDRTSLITIFHFCLGGEGV